MTNPNTRITPNSIVDQFINNVNTIILSQSRDQNSPPIFVGTTYYNNAFTNPNSSVAFSNPLAIPTADLDVQSNAMGPVGVGSKNTRVVGSTIYDVLCNVTRRLTRVRNFSSAWYHKTQDSYALINAVSGKAVFKESLPGIPGTSGIAANSATSGWERSVNGNATQAISIPNPGIEKGKRVAASNVNAFFTNLNNSWASASANTINYKFYSCHNNCHNNCHSSCHGSGRSRR